MLTAGAGIKLGKSSLEAASIMVSHPRKPCPDAIHVCPEGVLLKTFIVVG